MTPPRGKLTCYSYGRYGMYVGTLVGNYVHPLFFDVCYTVDCMHSCVQISSEVEPRTSPNYNGLRNIAEGILIDSMSYYQMHFATICSIRMEVHSSNSFFQNVSSRTYRTKANFYGLGCNWMHTLSHLFHTPGI